MSADQLCVLPSLAVSRPQFRWQLNLYRGRCHWRRPVLNQHGRLDFETLHRTHLGQERDPNSNFRLGQCRQNNIIVQAQGMTTSTSEHHRLKQMQIGEVVSTIPTVGFNVEFVFHFSHYRTISLIHCRSVTYGNLNFNVWVGSLANRSRFELADGK